jgi:AraC-like DNA-binding protein
LAYKDSIETKLYNNDNSIRTKGQYGRMSNIYTIGNGNYLAISDKGIYNYRYTSNTFKLIYTAQKEIIPIRNKINERIKDRGEFHFIDNKRYISLNVASAKIEVIDSDIAHQINDIVESDTNGTDFYAISNNELLLTFKRTTDGLQLLDKLPIKNTAHTISDYDNLVFLSGNNGISIFEKTKKQIIDNYIVDEFNKQAVYKKNSTIRFGSIHGVYTIDNLVDFEKNLIFKDFKISGQKPYLYLGAVLLIILYLVIKKIRKKNISDEQLISNIKRFINKNLSRVTLKMLEAEFNLDYNDINSIHKDFKPAKYIKQERLELTKKMLLKGKILSEISDKTGYSKTYLLKNKYKFLK